MNKQAFLSGYKEAAASSVSAAVNNMFDDYIRKEVSKLADPAQREAEIIFSTLRQAVKNTTLTDLQASLLPIAAGAGMGAGTGIAVNLLRKKYRQVRGKPADDIKLWRGAVLGGSAGALGGALVGRRISPYLKGLLFTATRKKDDSAEAQGELPKDFPEYISRPDSSYAEDPEVLARGLPTEQQRAIGEQLPFSGHIEKSYEQLLEEGAVYPDVQKELNEARKYRERNPELTFAQSLDRVKDKQRLMAVRSGGRVGGGALLPQTSEKGEQLTPAFIAVAAEEPWKDRTVMVLRHEMGHGTQTPDKPYKVYQGDQLQFSSTKMNPLPLLQQQLKTHGMHWKLEDENALKKALLMRGYGALNAMSEIPDYVLKDIELEVRLIALKQLAVQHGILIENVADAERFLQNYGFIPTSNPFDYFKSNMYGTSGYAENPQDYHQLLRVFKMLTKDSQKSLLRRMAERMPGLVDTREPSSGNVA